MLIVVTALISKLSVNLLLIDISKEKLFSSAIFYLSLRLSEFFTACTIVYVTIILSLAHE